MTTTKFRLILGCLLSIVLGTTYWRHTNLDRVLNDYDGSVTFTEGSRAITITRPTWEEMQRNRYFIQLWTERKKRDVTGIIVPYLRPTSDDVAANRQARMALQWLSEAENPQSLPVLRALSRQYRTQTEPLSRAAIDMAIGRIESRQLQGKARMDAMAGNMSLSWFDIIKLSNRLYFLDVRGEMQRGRFFSPSGLAIYRGFVEVLYSMGKKGENIEPLAKQLRLGPYEKLRLSCAIASPQKEVTLIFRYLDKAKAITPADDKISDNLADLGKIAEERIIERLQAMVRKPSRYRKSSGYIVLFQASRRFNNPKAKLLLKKLSRDTNSRVASYATFH